MRKNNLAGPVYEQLKSDIFEFRLLSGSRFSENDVARRARVSRTPVREALFRLVRVVLECAAVRKLCSGNPRAALAGLEKVWLVSPRNRLTDGARVARLDEEFHGALVAAAGNPELARIHMRTACREPSASQRAVGQ